MVCTKYKIVCGIYIFVATSISIGMLIELIWWENSVIPYGAIILVYGWMVILILGLIGISCTNKWLKLYSICLCLYSISWLAYVISIFSYLL